MTHDQPIVRLALVDDHQVFASSVGVALGAEADIEVVGTAHDLAGADRMLRDTDPQVVLLDHRLPDGDGVSALPQLRKAAPEASFVVLTASTAEQVLVSAIENGAAGFVSKTRSLGELTSALAGQHDHEGIAEAAYARDVVLVAMGKVREAADALEAVVADDLWSLPTYQEMLFIL